MNRNRNRRPAPKREPDTIESVCDRLDRIQERIKSLEYVDKQDAAHACFLINSVAYLLQRSEQDDTEDDEETESDDDDEDLDPQEEIENQAKRSSSRPRLDLRERWAGTLPTIDNYAASQQRKVPEGPEESVKLNPKQQAELHKRNAQRIAAMKDTNGIAGGHPDIYETTYDFSPSHLCGKCGSRLIDHSPDNNLPVQQTSEGPMQAYILCDRTRAYIPVP